jgi:hypothetical protein
MMGRNDDERMSGVQNMNSAAPSYMELSRPRLRRKKPAQAASELQFKKSPSIMRPRFISVFCINLHLDFIAGD